MVSNSPAVVLGSYASTVRDVAVDVARIRHGHAADAHQAAHTRTTRGYSTLWHDLLVDTQEAFADRGFCLHRLAPAGHKIPIVHDCLVYVWRLPATGDPSRFASSLTKKNLFDAPPPDPMLFDRGFMDGMEPIDDTPEKAELESVVRAVGDTMPLVLVMVHSSPRQLQSIEWAIAEFVEETDEVKLHAQESIWQSEPVVEAEASDVEPFDSGTPEGPTVEPQEQEETEPDA